MVLVLFPAAGLRERAAPRFRRVGDLRVSFFLPRSWELCLEVRFGDFEVEGRNSRSAIWDEVGPSSSDVVEEGGSKRRDIFCDFDLPRTLSLSRRETTFLFLTF